MIRCLPFIIGFALCLCLSQLSFAANINAPSAKPSDKRTARGVLRASQTAELTAAMSGQLLEVPYKSGQYFKKGALLAKFDCELQKAELTALEHKHQTLTLKYENAAELYKYGAAGELDVSLAQSEQQEASAQMQVMTTRLKDCMIYAPFAGYVTARHMSAFETPQSGQPLYSLQRAGSLELSLIVPSTWMRWLKTGHGLDFTVDETGDVFAANVSRISPAVDPVSQTIEIIAKPKHTPKALTGMSGFARFKPVQ